MGVGHGLLSVLFATAVIWLSPDGAQAQGTVGAQDTLSSIVVIPNPYNVIGRTWGQRSLSPESFERIRFANLPNTPCTITIYSSRGNRIISLSHPGRATNLNWDGRNEDNQYVVSDVYLFVVQSQTLGRQVGKFIIIR